MKPTIEAKILLEFLRKVEHLSLEERNLVVIYLALVSQPVVVTEAK